MNWYRFNVTLTKGILKFQSLLTKSTLMPFKSGNFTEKRVFLRVIYKPAGPRQTVCDEWQERHDRKHRPVYL